MKKEYIKLTRQIFDENMNKISDLEEIIITSLIADENKTFYCKTTGFTGGTRIDIGPEDSEDNYFEVQI